MRAWRWCWLLLPLSAALAEPTIDQPAVGVLDPAEAVDHARTRRLAEKVERLTERPGIALLIVFERGDEGDEPKAAQAWLEAWQGVADPPADADSAESRADEPAAETAAPAEDGESPANEGPTPDDLPKAVMSIRLASVDVDFAGSEGLDQRWPAAQREAAFRELKPFLTDHNLSGLLQALVKMCELLAGVPQADDAVATTAEPAQVAVEPPRPWLNGWLFVGLPVLCWVVILAIRHGPLTGLALAVPLAMLYSGLYFLLAFRPGLLILAGVLAFLPLWLVLGPVAPRPVRQAGGWQPVGGGLSQTGFGAFGDGAWSL